MTESRTGAPLDTTLLTVTLLTAFLLCYPALGAFVTLSQATLMDTDATRHAQNTARWTFGRSLGVALGPLALGTAARTGMSWREPFLLSAGLTAIVLVIASRSRFTAGGSESRRTSFRAGVIDALQALKRGEVLRWLTLLQFSDLMLDVLLGFLALYLVDVGGAAPYQAGAAVAVWTGMGLLGDLLIIPLLARVRGLAYLRFSTVVELILLPIFLLVRAMWAKLVLLGFLGLFSAGWYSVLKVWLYPAMPGQSATVMTVSNLFGLVDGVPPLGLGLVAEHFGLRVTMWLLLLGPVALLIGAPRTRVRLCSDGRIGCRYVCDYRRRTGAGILPPGFADARA